MRVLVTGGSGQLGEALQRLGRAAGHEVLAPPRADLNLAEPQNLAATVAALQPELVVNAGAYTAVDRAESDTRTAYAVNAVAPGVLAQAALACGARFAHVSTDYVFDGNADRPWRETDPVGPLNVYGASKYAGEVAVLAAHPAAAVVRTSWVFSHTGTNFVRTMLRLAERDSLSVVADQQGRPTQADDLARFLLATMTAPGQAGFSGRCHFSNGGDITAWHGFAEAVFAKAAQAGRKVPALQPVPTSAYPTPARRPLWSVMGLNRASAAMGAPPRDWRTALDETLTILLEKEAAA